VALDGHGCLICRGLLDVAEAQQDLLGPEGQREREALYGVERAALDRSGPSVVSINGVVASLAVTEFMVAATGLRAPQPVLTYYGQTGKVTVSRDDPAPDCYYCKAVRGRHDGADAQRYLRAGVGRFLR
jgi:molybdopterin-synthase adenylyltransferase